MSACQTQPKIQCPSCNPPTRHFEVVTECTDYVKKDLGNGNFSQCRYCTNKIYADGQDVTAAFKGQQNAKVRRVNQIKKEQPCIKM